MNLLNRTRAGFALMALLIAPLVASAQPTANLQYFRAYDQRGLNVFEPAKFVTEPYNGFDLKWGVGFTQQFQALKHSNTADVRLLPDTAPNTTYNANQLVEIGPGFNLATANLNLDVQLADGIRLDLISYLSSRHHSETWVKGGYLQIDKLAMIDFAPINAIMRYTRLRLGHFGINYGDAQFRRTDNGNALYNPFIENYLMDAFTTEIGAEAYFFHPSGLLAMVAATNGEIHGSVDRPSDRAPSYYGKVGFDRQFTDDLRLRLTGSTYTTEKSISNTLYGGDRGGSRYYMVLENTKSTLSGNFTSGRFNPGFSSKVTAFMVNPFVKYRGLELFGVYEKASGRSAAATETRDFTQVGGEAVYRFLPREQVYVGTRYNTVSGDMLFGKLTQKISSNRIQVSAGWFATPQLLLKGEYVKQTYNDFPTSDQRSGGQFNGFVMEGIVAF